LGRGRGNRKTLSPPRRGGAENRQEINLAESQHGIATLLKTSRTQVDRLLDPKNDIKLSSLQRAAAMVGRRVEIELVRKV